MALTLMVRDRSRAGRDAKHFVAAFIRHESLGKSAAENCEISTKAVAAGNLADRSRRRENC